MARKGNKANTVKKDELFENERIRLSFFVEEGSDEVEVQYLSNGLCNHVAIKLIAKFLKDQFDVICVPKKGFGGVIVCDAGTKEEFEEFLASMTGNDDDDDDNGNGENDGNAKGEDNNE